MSTCTPNIHLINRTKDKVKDVKFWVSLILTKRILQLYLNWDDMIKTHSKVLWSIESWNLEPDLWKPNLKCVQKRSISMVESSFETSKLHWLTLWKKQMYSLEQCFKKLILLSPPSPNRTYGSGLNPSILWPFWCIKFVLKVKLVLITLQPYTYTTFEPLSNCKKYLLAWLIAFTRSLF